MFRGELTHLQTIERKRIVMPNNVTMRIGRLEKPEAWPPELVDEIRRTAPFDLIQQYPNYPAFYERLAAHVGCSEDRIVVGAGIEEFIRIIMAGCFGKRMAVLWPTCAMVDVYAKAFNVHLDRIVTDPHAPPTLADVRAQVTPGVRVLMLANPGQPVETCYAPDELRALARHCAGIGCTLAIDEAYYGFGAPTAMPLIEEFENVLVLRTFSKAFGAAGIRLGFAAGGPKAKRAIDAVRQSGEVSSLSMHVATVLMDNYARFVLPSINEVCRARDYLRDAMFLDGLDVWGHHANHVLVDLGDDLKPTVAALAEQGIYPRATSVAPLEACMLITCGSLDLAKRFWERFRAS